MVEQLVDLQRHALEYAKRDGWLAQDGFFYAEQNAKTVKDAAEYYRSMFNGRALSWNLRDRHMADTLDALQDHLTRQRGDQAKIVVWEHNSHVGDARATEAAARGEFGRRRDLRAAWLERAIGVIYRPETERQSHYFQARVADQFDAVVHIDDTRAVEPLERTAGWEEGEAPETYPFAV